MWRGGRERDCSVWSGKVWKEALPGFSQDWAIGEKMETTTKYCLSLRLSKIKKIVYRFSLSVIGYYQVPVQWIQAAVEVFKDTGLKMTSRHSPEVLNLWVLLGGQ